MLTGALAGALLCAAPAWALHWPTLRWPWKHRAAAQPQPVHELAISLPGVQQYWDRNTLLVDLTHVGGVGDATLAPAAGGAWPVRLEFRVRPGAIGRLEVTGAQHLTFSVPAQGDAVVLKLDPGVYQPDTDHLTLRWSAAADLAR